MGGGRAMMRQRGRIRKTIKTAHSKIRWHLTSRKKLQRNHESKANADTHDSRSPPHPPPPPSNPNPPASCGHVRREQGQQLANGTVGISDDLSSLQLARKI